VGGPQPPRQFGFEVFGTGWAEAKYVTIIVTGSGVTDQISMISGRASPRDGTLMLAVYSHSPFGQPITVRAFFDDNQDLKPDPGKPDQTTEPLPSPCGENAGT
jgi:hypothetical protein